MRCSACGAENRPGARFCNGCGAALTATCASCGQGNPPGSRFCDACGQSLTGSARIVEPAHEPAPASLERYTPRHLAEKILAGRDALAGERKQVTVLFADVVGSTELIRDRDPEEAQRLLDGAVQRMMAAVHRYEGTVSRLLGDGLMAMFGAPIAHEDHAVRACYAALAMLEAIREYGEEVKQTDGATVQIRVGLNSGEVVVRLISDDLHMDYTAMGQTVHLAARIEGLATPGTVLLSASTLALVEGLIEARALAPAAVKGLEQPVAVYELRGAGAARTRLQAAAARGLTPFVGRDDELGAIDRALARAQAGQGQIVALVAEAGIGKSRLVWEAIRADRALRFRVLQTVGLSYSQTTTWLPVVDLLRTYFQIDSRDDHAVMREKACAGLLALDPALEPAGTALLSLLDVPVPDDLPLSRAREMTSAQPMFAPRSGTGGEGLPGSGVEVPWAQRDPAQRRRATLNAVQQLLLRESQRQPLLLVFEDLHWIDSETQALLDSLVEAIPTARILLLVNYRPEYSHGWGGKTYYTQLRLDPLEERGAGELLDALLGSDADVEPLRALLIRRTEGNPFFLEESVRALVETGVLVGERGAYRLTRPVEEIRVPATVQTVLAARIDRLPAEEKRLLQTAAVIGKDVPFALLQGIAERPEADLQAGLARLQAGELLYPTTLFPELELTFKHALTHDVAYGSLLQERRKALHARIVSAIEAEYGDRLDEHVERLAHHVVRGEVWGKAVGYCQQAGEKALARTAYREAVTRFEAALSALEHLPKSRDRLSQAIDLRLDIRQALMPLREMRSVLDHLRQAVTLAEALGDQQWLARALAPMANSLFMNGEHDQAIETGERALAIGRALDDVPLQVAAEFHLAYPYRQVGEFRRSVLGLKWIVATLQGESGRERYGGTSYPIASSRALLAWCLADLGDFAEGGRYGEEAIRIAEALDHPYSLGVAQIYQGYLYLRRGRLRAAISVLQQCRQLAERWDLPQNSLMASAWLGSAYAIDGRPGEGVSLLEHAVEQADAMGVLASYYVGALSEAYLLAGQLDDAKWMAGRAIDDATRYRERGYQAYALHTLGGIAAHEGLSDFEQADGSFRQALALADELEMRPLQAHCHLGLGKLYRRTGRLDEARAELTLAVAMLREMGMTFWLPEAEAELVQTDVST